MLVRRGTFAAVLDYRILGPLEVRNGDGVLHLGGSKQRSVLAILLLNANTVVSSDCLIDELWGTSPPEDAAMALQAHVSRLRKALPGGPELLATKPPGYMLEVAKDELDLERFERFVAQGRHALEAGDAARASEVLREALALWRGRPLADLESEPFAREATAHLEDSWLQALGLRIDADLALGRHAELVPELRALVRAHPLSEGFRVQLMLGLYRSGRQADALDVYTDARRDLNEQLGLEPGPALQRLQQQILVQDPELELAGGSRAVGRRDRRWAVLAVVAAAATAAVVAAVVRASDSGGPTAAPAGGALLAIDAESGKQGARTPIGRTPTAVAAGEGSVWLLDADVRTVSRFDPEKGTISTFATGATPTDIAVGAGAVWVGNGQRRPDVGIVGPVATSVARIDPTSMTERGDASLPLDGGALSYLVENHLATTAGALWAVAPDYSLVRIDAASLRPTQIKRPVPVQAVAAGPAGVWVLGTDGAVARLDERTARVLSQTRIPATSVAGIAVGDDAAWVTSPSDGTLWRIDAGDKPVLASIDVGAGVGDVAVGNGSVWVANPLAGTVTQVAIERAAVARTIEVGGVPRSIALDDGRVWVSLSNLGTPASTGSETEVEPLPVTSCEPVVYGGPGEPDVLIASDLMLQGGVRVQTTQMAAAIEYVLREHGFRAGAFSVAYQSCDDSIATTGLFDLPKCAANARAYVANPRVVGVVGTFNSPCAAVEIPILNRAPHGGVAMVSPTNSVVGLTRAGPGAPPDGLAALYPTGRRNYLRVFPPDDVQMAALAQTARRLRFSRIAVLVDGDAYWSMPLADAFVRAAHRLRLGVVFRDKWDPLAVSYRGLVQAVSASGAQAVVLIAGSTGTNGAQVVRELRSKLGPKLPLLGSEGFAVISQLDRRTRDAARGMYFSLNGFVLDGLPPQGAAFVKAFRATQPEAKIEPTSVYAAQATEVLLDAIARSNGTRASVIQELFKTRIRDGLLGDVSFDESGDISQAPVTILRVTGKRDRSNTIRSIEGAEIVRIERPESSLVR